MKDFFSHQHKNSNQSVQFDILPTPDYSHWQKCPIPFATVLTLKISSWNTISILAATIIIFFWGSPSVFSHLLNKRFSEFLNYAAARSFMHVYTPPPYIHLLYLCHCWAPLLLLIYSLVHPFHPSIRPSIHRPFLWALTRWGLLSESRPHPVYPDPVFLWGFFVVLFVKPNSAGGPVTASSSIQHPNTLKHSEHSSLTS